MYCTIYHCIIYLEIGADKKIIPNKQTSLLYVRSAHYMGFAPIKLIHKLQLLALGPAQREGVKLPNRGQQTEAPDKSVGCWMTKAKFFASGNFGIEVKN